jgi:hypothetical protein
MYILSKYRELSKQININEIAENFRSNLASNPPIFSFFFYKTNKKNHATHRKDLEEQKSLIQA